MVVGLSRSQLQLLLSRAHVSLSAHARLVSARSLQQGGQAELDVDDEVDSDDHHHALLLAAAAAAAAAAAWAAPAAGA